MINAVLMFVFITMSPIIVFSSQELETIQSSISEIENNPSNYEGKDVRVTGWLTTGCVHHGGMLVESDDGKSVIEIQRPDAVKHGVVIKKDDLFDAFWLICTDLDPYYPCKKETEVELEGRFMEVTKKWYGETIRLRMLVVTRVIRIEGKYRTPPTGICVEETPEEIYENLRKLEVDLPIEPKPELNLEIVPPKEIPEPPKRPRR